MVSTCGYANSHAPQKAPAFERCKQKQHRKTLRPLRFDPTMHGSASSPLGDKSLELLPSSAQTLLLMRGITKHCFFAVAMLQEEMFLQGRRGSVRYKRRGGRRKYGVLTFFLTCAIRRPTCVYKAAFRVQRTRLRMHERLDACASRCP